MSCLEREAGYILLGALCATLPAELLGQRPQALLALFEPALGPEAAMELDRRYCSNVVCWAGGAGQGGAGRSCLEMMIARGRARARQLFEAA